LGEAWATPLWLAQLFHLERLCPSFPSITSSPYHLTLFLLLLPPRFNYCHETTRIASSQPNFNIGTLCKVFTIISLVDFICYSIKRSLLCFFSYIILPSTRCGIYTLFPFFMVIHKILPYRFDKAYKQYPTERQEPKVINYYHPSPNLHVYAMFFLF
jgi:hypothetical protein